MKNLKDSRTKIYPSTTRGGKELPSSSALDSPSVLSKLATPKPASAIRSDMSHVIDDATSAMHDTYDETTSMLDTTVPLGEFLDEQLARARENEIIETDNIDESDDEDSPPRYELPVVPEGYVMDEETEDIPSSTHLPGNGARRELMYTTQPSYCRHCWASKCRGL